ncbi:MAG: hypothetical protein JSS81_02350 [Acidobacteria bacterium]|nr:hypothetical protein [Acidobacteriota bacterium]
MNKFQFCLIFIALCAGTAFGQKTLQSVYTGLGEKDCKAAKTEGDSYRGTCPGVGGYKLELLEGDLRQTINVIAPNGTKSELDLWSVVSGGFSSVGQKAEWRVSGAGKTAKPQALIVRFNASENPEDSTKITSYLVVVKISGNSACISEIVKPSADQNQKARAAADAAGGKPCRASE